MILEALVKTTTLPTVRARFLQYVTEQVGNVDVMSLRREVGGWRGLTQQDLSELERLLQLWWLTRLPTRTKRGGLVAFILVADDDESVRKAVKRALNQGS